MKQYKFSYIFLYKKKEKQNEKKNWGTFFKTKQNISTIIKYH